MFGKRQIVATESPVSPVNPGVDEVLAKTRRWGRNRAREEPRVFANRFSDVAPVWFYALVGKFWDRIEDSSLWSGHVGSLLLAQFIQTLSIIVESCGPYHPATQLLAHDLLELVWRFRDAEVSEVRSSVLCAVGSCLSVMPQDAVLRLLLGGHSATTAADLPRYIQHTCSSDRDPQCRALAERIASTISDNVKSIGV